MSPDATTAGALVDADQAEPGASADELPRTGADERSAVTTALGVAFVVVGSVLLAVRR